MESLSLYVQQLHGQLNCHIDFPHSDGSTSQLMERERDRNFASAQPPGRLHFQEQNKDNGFRS